ncbi:MAG: hypothetical protein EHM42_11905, partial [Planctomycetaceae bacterium]
MSPPLHATASADEFLESALAAPAVSTALQSANSTGTPSGGSAEASPSQDGPLASHNELDASAVVELLLEPAEIVLHAASRQQQLLITARRSDGRLIDVTRQAQISFEGTSAVASEFIRLDGTTLVGLSDGAAKLSASFAGQTASAPLRVTGFETF